jgi:hypothetical protein
MLVAVDDHGKSAPNRTLRDTLVPFFVPVPGHQIQL